MLWELGLAGLLLFVAVVGSIVWVALPTPQLDIESINDEDRRLLASQPAFIAFIIAVLLSLPYSQILMLVPMLQFLFYFALGAVVVIRQSVRQQVTHCDLAMGREA